MNVIGKLVLICLALALLERLIVALLIAIGLAAIYLLFFRTGDAIRLLVVLVVLSYPGWSIALTAGMIMLIACADLISNRKTGPSDA